MRIRTIKPEFWSHPVLGMLADESRLAAIGLLSLADDHGYFLAAPQLVRSALWPFDESSTKARRVLDDLCRIGYIEVRHNPEHGDVGMVANFKKHQRIDRPTPSKLACYFDSVSPCGVLDESSTNPRRVLDEGSLLEQGAGSQGAGSVERGAAPAPPTDHRTHTEDLFSGTTPTPPPKTMKPTKTMDLLRHAGARMRAGGQDLEIEWRGVVERYGIDAVLEALARLEPSRRWPQAVEELLHGPASVDLPPVIAGTADQESAA